MTGQLAPRKRTLRLSTRLEMIVRSLFIQATNNYERMLSFGFLFALWPALKFIYPDAESRRRAAIRHLAFFNTQPYFANCILGVVTQAELRGGEDVAGEVASIKEAMMGAFGALGDDLFWAGLMPAAALLALIIYGLAPEYALVGAVAALVAYNGFHLWARVRMFAVGLRLGRHITNYLRLLRLPQFVVTVKVAAAFLLGIFAAVVVWRGGVSASWVVGGVAAAAAVGATAFLQYLRLRPGLCWYFVVAAAVVVGAWIR
ncbi:MAG: PTS system mannose/fructose/sorbose family transporter subunit IID [Candidatus Coatesbacteria bacterium]|nr:MAG: PTS system mannose/fructose/sorbose family transporter subunit IID [Candidatus Coatesbacteria bacterium]